MQSMRRLGHWRIMTLSSTSAMFNQTLLGCTFQEDEVFENLISCIERGEIRPLVAKTFPLSEIRRAQEEFLAKAFTGKLVLVPPE